MQTKDDVLEKIETYKKTADFKRQGVILFDDRLTFLNTLENKIRNGMSKTEAWKYIILLENTEFNTWSSTLQVAFPSKLKDIYPPTIYVPDEEVEIDLPEVKSKPFPLASPWRTRTDKNLHMDNLLHYIYQYLVQLARTYSPLKNDDGYIVCDSFTEWAELIKVPMSNQFQILVDVYRDIKVLIGNDFADFSHKMKSKALKTLREFINQLVEPVSESQRELLYTYFCSNGNQDVDRIVDVFLHSVYNIGLMSVDGSHIWKISNNELTCELTRNVRMVLRDGEVFALDPKTKSLIEIDPSQKNLNLDPVISLNIELKFLPTKNLLIEPYVTRFEQTMWTVDLPMEPNLDTKVRLEFK